MDDYLDTYPSREEAMILFYVGDLVYGYYNESNSNSLHFNITKSKIQNDKYVVNIKDYTGSNIDLLNLNTPQKNNTGKAGYTSFTVSPKECANFLNNIVNKDKTWKVSNSENKVVNIPGSWTIPLIQDSLKYKTQSGVELDCNIRSTLRDDVRVMLIRVKGANNDRKLSSEFRTLNIVSSATDFQEIGLTSAIPTEKPAVYFAFTQAEYKDFIANVLNKQKTWKITNKDDKMVEIPGTWSGAEWLQQGGYSRKLNRKKQAKTKRSRKTYM